MFARFLSAALLIAAALPALGAADVPLPPLTPKGEYFVMTQDDATTSSKCIGDPRTPICAVETVMACGIRGNDDLCRIGMGLEKGSGIIIGPLPPRIYWVVRREVLTNRTLPWPPHELEKRPGEDSIRAGDVRIDIARKVCEKGEFSHTACKTPFLTSAVIAYIVRRQGDHWAAIDWRPPYENSPQLYKTPRR